MPRRAIPSLGHSLKLSSREKGGINQLCQAGYPLRPSNIIWVANENQRSFIAFSLFIHSTGQEQHATRKALASCEVNSFCCTSLICSEAPWRPRIRRTKRRTRKARKIQRKKLKRIRRTRRYWHHHPNPNPPRLLEELAQGLLCLQPRNWIKNSKLSWYEFIPSIQLILKGYRA